MSTKSRQRNEKRSNPNYRKELRPGVYQYYIRQKQTVLFEDIKPETKGAFGKAKVNRKSGIKQLVLT